MNAADIVSVAMVLFLFIGSVVLGVHRLWRAWRAWRERDELEAMYRAPSATSRWL